MGTKINLDVSNIDLMTLQQREPETRPPPPPRQPTTPPSRLSRLRGKPIVPDDFPGPTAAIRAPVPAVPSTTGGRSRNPLTGSRGSTTGSRNPTRGRGGSSRVVPTGNRARGRPAVSSKQQDELPEVPRASAGNSGRPVNRIPLGDQPDDDDDASPTGFPGNILSAL